MTDKFHIENHDLLTGETSGVREYADGTSEHVTLRPAAEGMPMNDGDSVVQTTPEPGSRGTLRIRTLYTHKGPARVSSKAYRDSYDSIFGGKQKVAEA